MNRIAILAALSALPAAAAPLSCFSFAAGAPALRASGVWEKAGDVLIVCNGGTPTAAGQPVPMVDLTLASAPAISFTSRVANPGHDASEALLLVDDPAPADQNACAATSVCPLSGVGGGGIRYANPEDPANGKQKVHNVFQAGKPAGASLTFRNVPFDPPGDAGVRILRLANLFVNASELGVPPGGLIPVSVTPSSSGGIALSLSAPFPVMIGVAFSSPAASLVNLGGSPASAVVLSRAAGNNVALAMNPGAGSAPDGATFQVRLAEAASPSAFRVRNGGNWPNLDDEPALMPQAMPGAITFSESGFYQPSFSGKDNLKRAGLASRGTRILVTFEALPAGVKLFAPIRIGTAAPATALRLVDTPAGGDTDSGFSPANATSPVDGGLAPLAGCPAHCRAVYEVVRTDATALENADIPIYVAFAPGAGQGSGTFRASLGPLSTDGTASGSTAPRFANPAGPAIEAFRVQ